MLARRIAVGLYAEHLDRENSLPPGLDEDLLHRLVQEGRQAIADFVDANRGLVAWEVERWRRLFSLDRAELFQEGCVGLLEAVRRWDETAGTRFGAYAIYWIREYVRACAVTRAGELGVPARALRREREGGLSESMAARLHALARPDSLYFETGEPLPVIAPVQDDAAVRVAEAVALLPGDEWEVVRRRHGWDGPPQSRAAVALALGLSRRRVAQLEASALVRLREHLVEACGA